MPFENGRWVAASHLGTGQRPATMTGVSAGMLRDGTSIDVRDVPRSNVIDPRGRIDRRLRDAQTTGESGDSSSPDIDTGKDRDISDIGWDEATKGLGVAGSVVFGAAPPFDPISRALGISPLDIVDAISDAIEGYEGTAGADTLGAGSPSDDTLDEASAGDYGATGSPDDSEQGSPGGFGPSGNEDIGAENGPDDDDGGPDGDPGSADEYHKGGMVRGKTGKPVKAKLRPGEFVMSREAVKHYGPKKMGMLNRRAVPKEKMDGV